MRRGSAALLAARAALLVVLAVPDDAAGAPLTCGTVTDTLAVGEVDTYELAAAPGSVIMVAVGEPTGVAGFEPGFTVTDGDDVTLASCSGNNGCNATATLTGPAPHTLTVFDVGSDGANTYKLSVVPLSDALPGNASCSTALGCDATTPITASLARGELHSYELGAAAGGVVMVGIAEPLDFFNFDLTFTLTNASGAVLATCTGATGCNQTATLDDSGPFHLTVFDANSDVANGYNLSVVPLSDAFPGETGCTVPVGCDAPTPITGTLELGEIDSYRLSAQPDSTIMIGVGEESLKGGFNPSFTLTDGDGAVLASCSAANGCNDTATLTGPEPYSVTVFDQGSDSSHGYNLSIVPLSDAFPGETGCTPPLGCDSQAPVGATLARGEIDSYQLEAQPNSVVMVAIAEPQPYDGFDPTFTLTDGNGAQIATCSAATGCNQRATLTGPAPYTLTVFDVGSDIPNPYNLSVVPLSDAFAQTGCQTNVDCTTPLPLTGSLVKGDLASYRLNAHAGATVTVDVSENPAVSGFNPAFTLTDGNGTELATCSGTNACNDQATLSGPPPFTVTVYDVGSDSANGYRVSPAITPCTPGTSTTTTSLGASTTTTSVGASTTTTTLGGSPGCSLPVTAGPTPKASDCLFILGTAVGSRTCTPECICDTDASGAITASDALRCLRAAVGQPVTIDCPC